MNSALQTHHLITKIGRGKEIYVAVQTDIILRLLSWQPLMFFFFFTNELPPTLALFLM